jgi:hemerythrin
MVFARWLPIYETGHPEIDEQHKQLFQMINRFENAMSEGHGQEVMEPILRELVAYTLKHFSAEETLMAASGYGEIEHHRNLHLELTGQVEELLLRFSKGYLTLPSTLSKFLANWLKHHIREEDMPFIEWLHKQST